MNFRKHSTTFGRNDRREKRRVATSTISFVTYLMKIQQETNVALSDASSRKAEDEQGQDSRTSVVAWPARYGQNN